MNHHDDNETELTTLATVAPGATIRLHDMAVELDEVDQLGRCDNRGSAAYGLELTSVEYLRGGKRRKRIYLSTTPVELLAS
ncbi:MAG: hypothetical protein ABWZ98_00190 [Nakamurella sp.]